MWRALLLVAIAFGARARELQVDRETARDRVRSCAAWTAHAIAADPALTPAQRLRLQADPVLIAALCASIGEGAPRVR